MRGAKRAGWASKLLVLPFLWLSQPAAAEVVAKSDNGFVVRLATEVTAPPAEAWRTLTSPALWWSSQHTFSGDAANLTLDPVVGGCFCEILPRPEGAPAGQRPGGVQHLRVVYIEPPRAIRLIGALGPLQSEALSATMTMTVKPTDKGSRILFEYVVGGYMRYKVDEIAPAVDGMLASQLLSLAGKLGPVAEPAASPPPSATSSAAPTAPDAELPPVPTGSKAVGPLSGAENYSLPPARGSAPAPRPVAKALPEPAPAAPAAPAPPKPAPKPAPKPVVKPPAKPTAKPAPKVPNPDDEAHRDANAAFDALLGASPMP